MPPSNTTYQAALVTNEVAAVLTADAPRGRGTRSDGLRCGVCSTR